MKIDIVFANLLRPVMEWARSLRIAAIGVGLPTLLASALAIPLFAAGQPDSAQVGPRVLVLALDGVPYRLLQRARENGAFEGWPEARPLVSTFPSMTNVSFTAMLSHLGAEPARGYEVRHYDPQRNEIHGGGFATKKKSFAWKSLFDLISRGNYAKARIYMTPRSMTRSELQKVEELVLESPKELLLAHVAATDQVAHFVGEEAAIEAVTQAAASVDEMRQRHLELRGRPLRVILLSDHGNHIGKVEVIVDQMRAALKAAGLRPSKKLERPEDVVLVAYGLVGYAPFYSDPKNARTIATALTEVEGVAFTAWSSGESEISVLAGEGLARIRWRDEPSGRRLQYEREHGDALDLKETLAKMETAGLVDDEGYASREDWFEQTASADNPDGLARLADSLSGTWVVNPATVIVGLKPGYGCAVRSVRVGAWFKGGQLEATHGGLDIGSSWGFFLDSSADQDYPPVLRVEQALAQFADRASQSAVAQSAP